MSAAEKTLTCDSCPEESPDVQAAMKHVTANTDHKMSAVIDEEGSTITVSINDGDENAGDLWGFGGDDQ
ncbi:hypothetical protein QEH68_06580 [Paenarthrobacter sp. OM7]|uniref:hypothetical protein n=1 Tax=Paenarthrobacter sp. OM7 TaxID=3041264 RepID=UPI002469843F|nr:hypothetical protein [Paenarthrobacter sp. OM7]WGM21834.1 hypothetical protein QEH68_06580 [Paenarthrobacter sp. OM7]